MADEGKKSKRRSRKEKPVADAPAEGEQRAESPRAAEAPAESPRAASSSPPEASHAASSSPAASSSSSSSSDPVPEFRRGKIYVNVPQGKDLPGGTKINPYWKAIVYPPREKLHRSEPLQKTDNPEWGNKGYLLILEEKHSTLEELRIEVWSQGSLSFRKKLGLVHFPLRVLLDGIPRAGWFECQPIPDEKKSGGGQITLQILYLPNDLDLTAQKYEFSETLHCLMRKNQRDCVQTLLRSHKEQVDMAQLDHSGRTPLQVAVELQDVEFIRLLVDNGAAVDGKNATGATALHHAVGLASEEVITTLLGLGATIDIQDKDGNTPLHFASGENHTAGLRVLLRNRANLNVQNAAGELPVMLAIRKEHLEVVFELASRDPALGPRTDIYLKNAAGESVADMLSNDKIPFPSITNFMRGAGIIDHREVTLLNKYPHRYHISGSGENILRSNWKLSPQFSLRLAGAAASSSGAASSSSSSSSSSSGPKVAILVHHTHNHFVDNQMQNIGLIAVDSIQGEHFEPSFQQNFGGRATSEPLELKFKPDLPFICLIPFARNEPAEGMFNILVFSEAPLEHAQLRPWKHIKSVQSKWEGESAGGPRGKPNFSKNPRVTLSLPSGHQSLAVNILIEQPRNVIDLDPYTVRPYALSIGYYIFDSNCTELIGQVPGFRNAQESFHVFNFDTTKHKKFTIIPATHEEGRESAFGITVFCDESFRLKVSK